MQVLDVRPGVTSLASIRYRNENELLEKVEDSDQYYINVVMQDKLAIDLEYIRNVSFGYDIRLVFQTFGRLFVDSTYVFIILKNLLRDMQTIQSAVVNQRQEV